MNKTWEGRKKIVQLKSFEDAYFNLLRKKKELWSNHSLTFVLINWIAVAFTFQLQCNHSFDPSLNSFQFINRHLQQRHRTGHAVPEKVTPMPGTDVLQPVCSILTVLVLLFHADGWNFCTALGVAAGFTFSWFSCRLPAALLSTLFSYIDSSTLVLTPALYSLMYNFIYLLAASLPRNQFAQNHFHSLCYLLAVSVIFFFFLYSTWPKHRSNPWIFPK